MPITSSPFTYTSQMKNDVARGMDNVAAAFAPPASGDLANYAKAGLDQQKRSIIDKLRSDPRYAGADAGVLAGLYPPTSSWQAQDQNNATTQRGQDVRANTDIATNANTVRGAAITDLFGSLNQGQVRPDVPANVASTIGLPAIAAVAGAPKPLSEDEVRGIILRDMTPAAVPTLTNDQLVGLATKGVGTQNVIGPDGKPKVAYDAQAVGQQPAYAPNATIMSDGLPKPPDGAVWKTGPDGKPVLDDRGAPIAIPYQGGALFDQKAKDDATATARKDHTDTQGNVVLQDIDRALSAIHADPMLTTGMGAKVTGWWDGGPAANVHALTDSIRTNVGLDQLQALRASNPNGAGLGNVTEKENAMLQAALGSLEQSQGQQQITDNLNRVKNIFLDVVYGPNAGPMREKLSFPSPWDNYTAPAADPSVSVVHDLPNGVSEDDVQFTMKKYRVPRDEVLRRLGVK